MKGINKVVWAEGVFLGQQHFQAWDQYQEHTRLELLRSQHGEFSGISQLKVDESALMNGRLELVNLKAVLPNGLPVEFERHHHGQLSLELPQGSADELEIHLAINSNELTDNISGYPQNQDIATWTAFYAHKADLHDVTRSREVLLARPNLLLRTSTQLNEQLISLPLLKVKRILDQEWQLSQDFLPPCLNLRCLPFFNDLMTSTAELLRSKLRPYIERRSQLSSLSHQSPDEIADYLHFAPLTHFLQQLRQLQDKALARPEELFRLLSAINQHVLNTTAPEHSLDYIAYDPLKPHVGLSALQRSLNELLRTKAEDQHKNANFKLLGSGRWESDPLHAKALQSHTFYLAVSHDNNDLEWVKRFPLLCKLASPQHIETIVATGLPGIELVHCQRLPSKIRVKSGIEYFRIEKSGSAWEQVQSQQILSAFALAEFSECHLELIVIEE